MGNPGARVFSVAVLAGILITVPPAARGQMATLDEREATRAASIITPAGLERHLGVISHDSMRGRDTPSPGLMMTAEYIADRFRDAGLEPGAGDGYVQSYPMTSVRPAGGTGQSLRFVGDGRTWNMEYGSDFFVQLTAERAEANGELVVVQGAQDMPTAAGRIAVLRVTAANLRDVFGGRLRDAIREARPAGLIVVMDVSENRFDRFRRFLDGERVVYGAVAEQAAPIAFVARSSLPSELAGLVVARGEVSGWSAKMETTAQLSVDEAPNTIGILPGSDPMLRDEYVLFMAHMDHDGVGAAVNGDSIYNGADDNGSGTVSIIELARAFATLEPAPRRSLIFLTVSGEEKGLLGSRYYGEHPSVPLENTVAAVNLDMVGRNWPDTIVVIGKAESTLGPQVERIAAAHPELDMAVIDDPWPEESFYTRSDHYNLARRGVPILFFFNGTHADYHRPSDEADRIDYEKMARIGRLAFFLGLDVANADERPAWDPDAYDRVVERPRS